MKRYQVLALVSLSWLTFGVAVEPAYAQIPIQQQAPLTPTNKPFISPYLNLLRPGDPNFNYQTLVRPQVEFRSGIGQLNQQLQTTQRQVTNLEVESGLPPTGHATQFLNLGGYFLSRGGGRGTAGGTTAGGGQRRNITSTAAPASRGGYR